MSADTDYSDLFLRAAVAVESVPPHLRETVAHFVALHILRGEERISSWRAKGDKWTIYILRARA